LSPLPPVEVVEARPGDELDPELLALPAPTRRERTLALVVLVAGTAAALAMVFALRNDMAYAATAAPIAADIGDLAAATEATLAAHENGFVRATGVLGAAAGIRYRRPLHDDTYRALPVLGPAARAGVWVEVRVPSGEESGRWEPPHAFAGRLLRFDAAGLRHRGVARAIEEAAGAPIPPGSFLLVDDEAPHGLRWSLLLGVLFLACAAANGVAAFRIVQRVG